MQQDVDVDRLIDQLIEREGGHGEQPCDKGGATCLELPKRLLERTWLRREAAAIYKLLEWSRPRLDEIAQRSAAVAAELFDAGVNMGRLSPSRSCSGRSPP
jgi:lysozyme family protein